MRDEISQLMTRPKTTIKIEHFIKYLRLQNRSGESARRIVEFTTHNNQPNRTSLLCFHSPKYKPGEDRGFGKLQRGFRIGTDRLCNIELANPSKANAEPNYTYYSIGYPSFPHFNTDNHEQLVQELKCASLTMVSSSSGAFTTDGAVILSHTSDSKWRIGTPTAKGMSGGPVLSFNSADHTIKILGVISSGNLTENYMCTFM